MSNEVLVVIGAGGMGEAIARRQGTGRKVLLADFSDAALQRVADALRVEGYDVSTQIVDVSDRASVQALAQAAGQLGAVTQVVHTAGLSPVQAAAEAILRVDLAGTAFVLDEFGKIVAPGGAGVVIASMAGHLMPALPAEQEGVLALTPSDDLLQLPFVQASTVGPGAYGLAKRANQLRVQAASTAWGERGARINSVSPGIISTAMGQQELSGGRAA
jgi:NAD(P)-dependent dehydrogenase (short-subunit alcohol dehydrogenase family)